MGEPEAALECFAKGDRGPLFNPYAIAMFGGRGMALVQSGQDEAAIDCARAGLELSTEYGTFHRILASALAHLGRMDEAAAALAEALRLVPDDTIANGWKRSRYVDKPATRRYFEGLRRAGMPEGEE